MNRDDDAQAEFRFVGDTVWGDNADKETPLQHNIQIDIGVDATDIWMVFNKATSAVQLTHEEGLKFLNQFSQALGEGRAMRHADLIDKAYPEKEE